MNSSPSLTVPLMQKPTLLINPFPNNSQSFSKRGYHTLDLSYCGRVRETFGKDPPQLLHGNILDIGCSLGETTLELSTLYPQATVFGIDINISRIKYASDMIKGKNVFHLVADGLNIPFPENSYDAVFCMNNIYHVLANPPRPKNSLRLAHDSLRGLAPVVADQGYLLLSSLENWIIFRRQEGHFCTISEHATRKTLVRINAEISDIINSDLSIRNL